MGTGSLVIPSLYPFLYLFAGRPRCFTAAREQKQEKKFNHLMLPELTDADLYRWPVEGCTVIVILFIATGEDTEAMLFAALFRDGACEVILRHWPDTALIIRRIPHAQRRHRVRDRRR